MDNIHTMVLFLRWEDVNYEKREREKEDDIGKY